MKLCNRERINQVNLSTALQEWFNPNTFYWRIAYHLLLRSKMEGTGLGPFTASSTHSSTHSFVLTLGLSTKSHGVTIQMKPLRQYFCMVPFLFQYFTK